MELIRKVKLLYDGGKIEKVLAFREIPYHLAKDIILTKHYSHTWLSAFGRVNIGVFENDKLLGVAAFGNLMNPKSYKNINKNFNQNSIIELNRLWVDDYLGKNSETVLLSASFKIIKQKYPHIKAIQSFADGRLGCGTIYKACNFKYFGSSKTLFYENILNGKIYHNVPFDNTLAPNKMIILNGMFIRGELRAFYVKTYKYIYPLYKNVIIDLPEKPYPAYDIGLEYTNIKLRKSTMARAFILSYIFNYSEYYDILNWAKENNDLILFTINNKSIKLISERRKKLHIYNAILENPDLLFRK